MSGTSDLVKADSESLLLEISSSKMQEGKAGFPLKCPLSSQPTLVGVHDLSGYLFLGMLLCR